MTEIQKVYTELHNLPKIFLHLDRHKLCHCALEETAFKEILALSKYYSSG